MRAAGSGQSSNRVAPRYWQPRSGRHRRSRHIVAVALACLLSGAAPSPVTAAGERLRSALVASGGGDAGNGLHRLRASAGQGAIGRSSSTTNVLCSGFWCVGAAITLAVEDPPGAGQAQALALSIGMPSPNPCSGRTRFTLTLPGLARVSLTAFDVAGRRVGDGFEQLLGSGIHDVWWSPTGVSPGTYFVRVMVAGRQRAERRVVILR